jgi:hypothetical protein
MPEEKLSRSLEIRVERCGELKSSIVLQQRGFDERDCTKLSEVCCAALLDSFEEIEAEG